MADELTFAVGDIVTWSHPGEDGPQDAEIIELADPDEGSEFLIRVGASRLLYVDPQQLSAKS